MPTTISLFNNDAQWYAATAEFLKHGSTRYLPSIDAQRPVTIEVSKLWHRPGSSLLIGFCGQLFHLPAYRVFFVLLAVMTAASTPLVGIFVWAVGGSPAVGLLALTLSAFNVNQLYYLFQGFAGQVFFQGCLLTAFILLWKAEDDREHWRSYALIIGLLMCAMFDVYVEGSPAFVISYGVYVSFQLFLSSEPKWRLVGRYFQPVGIALALDPFTFWNGLGVIYWRAGVISGWSMPRWALPVDIVGLMASVYHGVGPAAYHSEALAAVASIPIIYFAVSGCREWRNSRLSLSVALVVASLLAYNYGVRDFSYGYHKVAAIFAFFLIAAFAGGVSRALEKFSRPTVRRYALAVASALAAAGSFVAARPLLGWMSATRLVVTPDLADVTAISSIAGTHSIRISGGNLWDEAWAAQFLEPLRVHLDVPNLFGAPHIEQGNELTLEMAGCQSFPCGIFQPSRILWKNQSYLLVAPAGPNDRVPVEVSRTKADLDRLATSPKEQEAEREFQRLLTEKRRTHGGHD
ncbi:MAG: hypothetical protein ACHQZS_09880 [Candidatus Binatales bacterium]